jgi:hypothetical protein
VGTDHEEKFSSPTWATPWFLGFSTAASASTFAPYPRRAREVADGVRQARNARHRHGDLQGSPFEGHVNSPLLRELTWLGSLLRFSLPASSVVTFVGKLDISPSGNGRSTDADGEPRTGAGGAPNPLVATNRAVDPARKPCRKSTLSQWTG